MSDISPSLQEWTALYEAAIEFKKVECWNWMQDSDIFGVKNPATGEIGYCCILGRLGDYFGLAVYLGTEGFKGYLKLQLGDPESGIETFMLQKCLMAAFRDRTALQKPDLEQIKKLGLKFRGRNEWPLFRSYLPGYHPWYLTSEEAKFLTLALHQAVDVALRFKEDPDMLEPLDDVYVFVRVPEEETDELRWHDEWLKPPLIEEEAEFVAEPVDEVRLDRLKRIARHEQGTWEIDYFYIARGARDGKGRPYYPYAFIWVDHHSGFIYHSLIVKPSKPEYRSEFMEEFLSFIENTEVVPDRIMVSKEELFQLLEPVTSVLDIELKRSRELKEIEQVKAGMLEFFG